MNKRKNKCCFLLAGTLASFIFLLQPTVYVVFAADPPNDAAPYIFTSIDIPTSRGEFGFTSLDDINDKGESVGNFVAGPVGFLLDEKTKFTEIECPGAINSTAAKAINNRTEISGFCFAGGKIHGFFRNKKGKYTLLDFPRANLTEASGINQDGQVVGDYRDSGGKFHGFFWDAGLFLTFDVPFPGATLTAPNAINNVGQIVGFYFDNNVTESFPNGQTHGFLYDNGFFTSFDFPGATATLPMDINDHGQIVGIYADSDMMAHSFLLEDGKFTTFEVPFPGVVATDVSGINNGGQIVGRYLESNPDNIFNPFFNHGFIATPKTEPKSKSQLLISKQDDLSRAKRGGAALALALDGCSEESPKPGHITPTKLSKRWLFCSQTSNPK